MYCLYLSDKHRRDNHVLSLTFLPFPVFTLNSSSKKAYLSFPRPSPPSSAWDGVWEEGVRLPLGCLIFESHFNAREATLTLESIKNCTLTWKELWCMCVCLYM